MRYYAVKKIAVLLTYCNTNCTLCKHREPYSISRQGIGVYIVHVTPHTQLYTFGTRVSYHIWKPNEV